MRWLCFGLGLLLACGGPSAAPGRSAATPAMPAPADDLPPATDPDRLYQAAAVLADQQDTSMLAETLHRLGLIDAAGQPTAAMAPFADRHSHWVRDNAEWALALASDLPAARAYLADRLGLRGHRVPAGTRRHRLFQAASRTGDPALLADVERRLGVTDARGMFRQPAYERFMRAHQQWAAGEPAFAALDATAGRAYLLLHLDELPAP